MTDRQPDYRTADATESAAASLAEIVALLEQRAELRKVEMPTVEHDNSIEARKREMENRVFRVERHGSGGEGLLIESFWFIAKHFRARGVDAEQAIQILCLNVGESVDVAGARFTRTR